MADKLRGGTTIGGFLAWHYGNMGSGSGLDADLLDGFDSTYFSPASHTHDTNTISNLDASDITTGTIDDARLPITITSDITGNAATATKLVASKSIALNSGVTGSALFDGSSNISITTTVNHLNAVDDRDVKPNTTGISASVKAIKPFFTSLEGMTGAAGTDYQDLLVLDTYGDASGGKVNALTFDKSTPSIIRHWQANQGDTTWGVPESLAYQSWVTTNYEPVFSKNTGFNKNFGTTTGTVAQGDDSRIINGQTAFGWGDHSIAGYLTAESDPLFSAHTVSTIVNGTGFLKNNGTGIWSYDNNSYSLTSHNHTGVYEPVITKNTGFNKNFGTTVGTVSEGHLHPYLPLTGGTLSGDLRIENTYPRIFLTDTDHNSDYSIINNNGVFGIYDDTNITYRFTIDQTGVAKLGTNTILHSGNFGTTAGTVAEGNDTRIIAGAAAWAWGDHSAAGYLTSYTESDPVFTAHTVSNIINGTGFLKNNGTGTWSYDNNSYSLTSHNHSGVYEPVITKNTAFNKNFGTTAGTVSEGDHTHSTYAALAGSTGQDFSTNNLVVQGSLTVNGPTTEINATTLKVDDKNIELGTVATPTDITAADGGITLLGDTNKTFTWSGTTGAWTSNQYLSVKMNGAPGLILEDTALNYEGYTGFYSVQGSAYIYTPATTSGNGHIGFMEFGGGDLKGELQVRKNAAWNVVFHEANQSLISITESQISDFGTYLTDISNQSIESLIDVNTMTPTDGQVLTYDFVNSRWDAADPTGGAGIARQSWSYVATAGQTNFTITYDNINTVDVFIGGSKAKYGDDYTLNAGTTLILTDAAEGGEPVDIYAWNDTSLYVAPTPVVSNFEATFGQTVFTTNYNVQNVEVWSGGIKLSPSTYTATNGTSITLHNGADAGTWIQIITNADIAPGTLPWTSITDKPDIGVGIKNTYEFVATASQTTFSGADTNALTLSYVPGNIYVIVDGFHINTNDYTATNGTSIVFSLGLNAGQEVSIIAFDEFTLANVVGDLTVDNLTVNGTITETSARKYKENIKPLENSLDKVMQLEGVTYNMLRSQKTEVGLIADDVNEIIPEVVRSKNGEVEGINYSRLVALLIESVKELKNEVDELKGMKGI